MFCSVKKNGVDDDDDDDRDLKIQQRDGNENVYKTIGLISRKTTNCTCIRFFYIYTLPFLHDHDVKMLNLVFYAERKQTTTKVYFAF